MDTAGVEIIETKPEPILIEDDVPADFFDDFLNQDFMAGLDVVDAWDEECAEIKKEKIEKDSTIVLDKEIKTVGESERKSLEIRSKNKEGRNSKEKGKEDNEKLKKKSNEQVHKSKKTENEKVEENLQRRDPIKTKRDIQKDKAKCAKDKEVKIMSERLKVVETGLVPPGMEMEIDLDEITQQTNSKHYALNIEEPFIKENAYVCGKERRRHSEIIANERKHLHKITTPEKKFRELSFSFSDVSEREIWLRERSPSNRKERSSKRRHVRSRSRDRDVLTKRKIHGSDKWMHRSRHLSRSRSRERNSSGKKKAHSSINESPPRKKGKSFLEELDDKLSKTSEDSKIFKEIQQKINSGPSGASSQQNMTHLSVDHSRISMQKVINPLAQSMMQHQEQFNIVPNPASALIPQTYFQPQIPEANYDEQFFIGEAFVPNPFQHGQGPASYPQLSIESSRSNYEVRNPASNIGSVLKSVSIDSNAQQEPLVKSLEKMFAEKQISLTDYLRISVNGTDPGNPMSIQNKIKVISRCQDAIKEFSRDGKINSHFTFKKITFVKEKSAEVKYQSPLKKTPFIRFQFTTAPKANEEHSPFTYYLSRLLAGLRIPKETVSTPKASPAVLKPSNSENFSNMCNISSAKKVTVFSQTDVVRCEKCEMRGALAFNNQYSQTVPVMTFSTGTQVSEEDFRPKENDFLKNKSLAYLTPAQLLGQAKADTSFPSSKYPILNRSESISQEKRSEDFPAPPQNIYFERNATTQDNFNRSTLNQAVRFNAPYKSFDGRPLPQGDPRMSRITSTPSGICPPTSQNYPGNRFNAPIGYNNPTNSNRPVFNPSILNSQNFGYSEEHRF